MVDLTNTHHHTNAQLRPAAFMIADGRSCPFNADDVRLLQMGGVILKVAELVSAIFGCAFRLCYCRWGRSLRFRQVLGLPMA